MANTAPFRPSWSLWAIVTLSACAPGNVTTILAPRDASYVDTGFTDVGNPDVSIPDAGVTDLGLPDVPVLDASLPDIAPIDIPPMDIGVDAGVMAVDAVVDTDVPTTLDLHQAILSNNPTNLADWPVTTTITEVDFEYMGSDGVHVEFSHRDDGAWPDVTPPGWDGTLEYTLGFAEFIGGQWYASAAIQFWRGLPASGGNVAEDVVTMGQCTSFGEGSSCQVARNWYYDTRWGSLAGYQPATGELIGVFVVAGNVRGVTDGSQSPVQERSNVVLVPMPTFAGASYTF